MRNLPPVATLLLIAGLSDAARADASSQETRPQLSFTAYLRRVLSANPDLAAARATLDVARAQIDVAKVFPDPELNLGVNQYDLTRRGNPTILGTQLSLPIELGGKRRARVALAQSGDAAAGFDYADAERALRALAANAFIDALHARLVVGQKRSSLGHLQHLVEVNQRRLAAGDIAEIELVQSRVELQQFRADVLDAEGEEEAAETVMAQLLGDQASLRVYARGELYTAAPSLDRAALAAGIDRRGDIRAAVARVEGARRQLDLEHAKRVVDVTVGVGWLHSLPEGGGAGLPSADMVAASVSVPVPLSRIYRGEIAAAESAQRQAQSQLQAVRVRAVAELYEAFARFRSAARRVAVYDEGTLLDANAVLEKTLYSYQRGEASLVEVLIAQRTASETQLAYLDALADRAHALVAVGQAAGLTEELLVL
jgi:outer membrane protein, heavy metal efflux system